MEKRERKWKKEGEREGRGWRRQNTEKGRKGAKVLGSL